MVQLWDLVIACPSPLRLFVVAKLRAGLSNDLLLVPIEPISVTIPTWERDG